MIPPLAEPPEQPQPQDPRGPRVVVARFYQPLRIPPIEALFASIEHAVGSICYLQGEEGSSFTIVTYGEPLPQMSWADQIAVLYRRSIQE